MALSRPTLRFSLATMFVVVTVACMYLGWNAYCVRERGQIVKAVGKVYFGSNKRDETMPLIWQLLGAKEVEAMIIPPEKFSPEDCRRIRSFFPEAYIFTVQNKTALDSEGKEVYVGEERIDY